MHSRCHLRDYSPRNCQHAKYQLVSFLADQVLADSGSKLCPARVQISQPRCILSYYVRIPCSGSTCGAWTRQCQVNDERPSAEHALPPASCALQHVVSFRQAKSFRRPPYPPTHALSTLRPSQQMQPLRV